MKGHLKYVLAADMSPDEKMLVTGGADKALNLWEVILRDDCSGHQGYRIRRVHTQWQVHHLL